MAEHLFEEISKFMQDKGFIYGPEPEIYNGIAGFYSYGPIGKALKNKIENKIKQRFESENFWEVECPIIQPPEVWEASGHLKNFFDEIITYKGNKYRLDKIAEEQGFKDAHKAFKEGRLKTPDGKGFFKGEIKKHELMMKTNVGMSGTAYNRPETATTSYLPFRRYLTFFRDKLPFGIFQIGKAFRNELSPRQNVLRMREFTQAEAQIFLFKKQKNNFAKFDGIKQEKACFVPNKGKKVTCTFEEAIKNKLLKNKAFAYSLWLAQETFRDFGLPMKNLRLRQHNEDEMAFYADDAWDLEVNLNTLGWFECCGIHDRTDYDLKQHAKLSGSKLEARNEEGKAEIPQVIEIAFGIDRPLFALIDNAYYDDKERGNKVLHFNKKIAPVQIAVFPLVKKLSEEAKKVVKELKDFKAVFDESGSIGRRYARADEQGIPYCITIDFDTLSDESVTVRNITDTKQERIKITGLSDYFKENLL